MARRPDGSIYARKDKSGKIVGWVAALTISGKNVRRLAPDRQTAKRYLDELIAKRDSQIDIVGGSATVQVWLSHWFADKKAAGLKPTAEADYRELIQMYILPALGSYRLDQLTPEQIQAWVWAVRDGVRERGAKRAAAARARAQAKHAEIAERDPSRSGPKPVLRKLKPSRLPDGARTTHKAATILRDALELAVQRRKILASPYVGITLPEYRAVPAIVPDEDEVRRWLAVEPDDDLYALWLMYALLGLRRGEGIGLRLADWDRQRRTIRVTQQVTTRGVGTPKTQAGYRTLALPPVAQQALEHRAAILHRQRQQPRWQEHGLLFCTRDGKPLSPRNVSRMFDRRSRLAGVTCSPHSLRRSLATLLDEVGATETVKAAILGHAKATITQHYTEARITAISRVLEQVADRLFARSAHISAHMRSIG